MNEWCELTFRNRSFATDESRFDEDNCLHSCYETKVSNKSEWNFNQSNAR